MNQTLESLLRPLSFEQFTREFNWHRGLAIRYNKEIMLHVHDPITANNMLRLSNAHLSEMKTISAEIQRKLDELRK